MTCTAFNNQGTRGIVCETPEFKPGDPMPSGYLAWHEWAEVQHKAGLRQVQCGRCGKWQYPQQLSKLVDRCELKRRSGALELVEYPVCLECAK